MPRQSRSVALSCTLLRSARATLFTAAVPPDYATKLQIPIPASTHSHALHCAHVCLAESCADAGGLPSAQAASVVNQMNGSLECTVAASHSAGLLAAHATVKSLASPEPLSACAELPAQRTRSAAAALSLPARCSSLARSHTAVNKSGPGRSTCQCRAECPQERCPQSYSAGAAHGESAALPAAATSRAGPPRPPLLRRDRVHAVRRRGGPVGGRGCAAARAGASAARLQ